MVIMTMLTIMIIDNKDPNKKIIIITVVKIFIIIVILILILYLLTDCYVIAFM